MPYKNPEVRKAKHAEYSKAHYERNKKKVIERSAESRKKFKAEWAAFKETLKCYKCGFSHPAAMDFHHINPKEKEAGIDRLVRNCSWENLYKEMAKCIVLCANCHRITHHDERLEKSLAKTKKDSKI